MDWKKIFSSALFSIATIAGGFFAQTRFPMGALPWLTISLVCIGVIAFIYRNDLKQWWLNPRDRQQKHESNAASDPDAFINELRIQFDANPGNGRIAAKLILLSQDIESAEHVYEAFKLVEAEIGRYCPECAFAAKLVEHDETLRARSLLSETQFSASFAQTSADLNGGRKSAEVEYKTALNEFYFGAGGPPDLFEEDEW